MAMSVRMLRRDATAVTGTNKVRNVALNRHAGPRPPDSNRGASGEGLAGPLRELHVMQMDW